MSQTLTSGPYRLLQDHTGCWCTSFNPFTAVMSLENNPSGCKIWYPYTFLSSFFALAREKSFIKMHRTERRCVTGPENTLFAGASVQLSARKYYRLGSEGVKGAHRVVVVVVYCWCWQQWVLFVYIWGCSFIHLNKLCLSQLASTCDGRRRRAPRSGSERFG